MRTTQEIYKKYFIDNNIERRSLFEALTNKYPIKNALYPGSFAHITASFFIPKVVYIDLDKQAKRFFKDREAVNGLIAPNKVYRQEPSFEFIAQDYSEALALQEESFDLLISQFSGIISRYCKSYLKIGGLLLTNNSHADAGVAHLDSDYELIAVANEIDERTSITDECLEQYFIPPISKKTPKPTSESLIQSGKGIKYTLAAENYLFRRVR